MTISYINKLGLVIALCFLPSLAFAGEGEEQGSIVAALSQIRSAALQSEPEVAASFYAEDLALISQSGKLYGKEAVLFDLQNPFDAWENSDIAIRENGNTAIVTFVNSRTRGGMEPASFLVLQVWRNDGDRWLITAQSSTLIKSRAPVAP